MTKKPKKNYAVRRAPAASRHEYEVGYGKPPVESQWSKGRSGNPTGRPKGAKNINTIVHQALRKPVMIRENGEAKRVPAVEAMFLRHLERAMKGDTKSAAFVLSYYDEDAIQRQEVQRAIRTGKSRMSPQETYNAMIAQVRG